MLFLFGTCCGRMGLERSKWCNERRVGNERTTWGVVLGDKEVSEWRWTGMGMEGQAKPTRSVKNTWPQFMPQYSLKQVMPMETLSRPHPTTQLKEERLVITWFLSLRFLAHLRPNTSRVIHLNKFQDIAISTPQRSTRLAKLHND